MRRVNTWYGMTAQEIIDNRDGTTVGGDAMTRDITWQYRSDYLRDGTFDSMGPAVCGPERANCIVIIGFSGPIARLEIPSKC